jgi:hypothetical protein
MTLSTFAKHVCCPGDTAYQTPVSLFYTDILHRSTYALALDRFIPGQDVLWCTKITKLFLCDIIQYFFLLDDLLWIETCRKLSFLTYQRIMSISKAEHCAFCWLGAETWLLTDNSWNGQYNVESCTVTVRPGYKRRIIRKYVPVMK